MQGGQYLCVCVAVVAYVCGISRVGGRTVNPVGFAGTAGRTAFIHAHRECVFAVAANLLWLIADGQPIEGELHAWHNGDAVFHGAESHRQALFVERHAQCDGRIGTAFD